MASLAASSPRAQRQTAPDSATRRMAPLTSSSPSPHSRSAPGSSTRSRASAAASSPHRHSAPGSSTLAASSPRAQRMTAPDSATRRMASLAISSPSPHRRSAPGSPTRSRASPAASSPSAHGHSASGSSTLAELSSSPVTPTTSPPRPVDSVRVYALRDSCMVFVAELGRTDLFHDAAEVREQSPVGSEEQGDIVLAFMSKGSLCGIANLVADAPGQGSMESDDEEEEEEKENECAGDDEDSEGEEDEDEEEEEEEDEDSEGEEEEDEEEEEEEDESADDDEDSEEEEDEEEEEEEDESADDDEDSQEEEGEEEQYHILDLFGAATDDNDGANEPRKEHGCKEDGEDGWVENPAYSLKIRVWSSCAYANIVLFDGASWMSTRSYSLSWLSSTKAEIMMEKLADLSQIDMKIDVSSLVPNAMVMKSEYEGQMVNSAAVEMFVKCNLSPRLYHFDVKNIIGKGAFANVRLCTGRDHQNYAVKIIKSEENDLSEPREISILSSLRSQHVVKFLQGWTESYIFVDYEECSNSDMSSQFHGSRESGKSSTDMQRPRYVLIQMELCKGTLADYLSDQARQLDNEESLQIFEEIVQSVAYAHGQNVIHRDIKPSNIFKGKDNKFKLGDFGQSRVQPRYAVSFKATPYLGTRFYAAPELRKGENVSNKVDIYPLGVIYFDLFKKFWTAMDKDKEFTLFMNDESSNIAWNGDFCLFKQMTAFDPVKRPSVNHVLEHISQLRSSPQQTEDSTPVEEADTPGSECRD